MVEVFSEVPVTIVPGSYENIKITTPEDLIFGQAILDNRSKA
ncbi:MAG: 2-C-methyl-D-erythritol 4-phosphate cytidylyltransferase [Lactococcus raffinolactis]